MTIATPALYVSCIGIDRAEGHVIALDPSDLSVKDHVTLTTGRAARLAMRPDGFRLWVSHPGQNLISILNANTFNLEHTINFGDEDAHPYQMAIRTISKRTFPQLMLACQNVNKIYVYNMYLYTRAFELNVETDRPYESAKPDYVKLDPSNRLLYTYSHLRPQTRDNVFVIDLGDDNNLNDATQIDEICFNDDCIEPPDFNVELQEAVFNSEGTRLYIANRVTNRIEVIDTTENVFLEPIIIEEYTHPRALAISPTGTYLYVGYTSQGYDEETESALPGYVVMLSLDDKAVVDVEAIPNNPRTMVLNPSGDRLFVAEHQAHEIYAFDIDVEREDPMSLYTSVNLDAVVDSGYAGPVDLLYLESRYVLPIPYALYVVGAMSAGFNDFVRRIWSGFINSLTGVRKLR